MFCPKCATQNTDDSNFCRNCGANLAPVGKTGHNIVTGIKPDKYAGFWIRAVSLLIDLFVLGILIIICGFSVGFIFGSFGGITFDIMEQIYTVVGALLCIFYETWMTVRFGQTIGKAITGIRVVTTHNEYVSYKLSVLRFLGKIVNLLTLCIGFLLAVFHYQKRGLHDMIANTKVVYVK